jgi:hypothetical protein
MFGPSVRRMNLLCPRLTSATSSHRLSATVARGKVADLPGYCAPTFTLMPAAYTYKLSVQVSDFEEICLLIQLARLICDSCSSGQRFACGFLQIPPRGGHPCRPANDSPCRVRRRLSLPSGCALPGAQKRKAGRIKRPSGLSMVRCENDLLCGFFSQQLDRFLQLQVFCRRLGRCVRFDCVLVGRRGWFLNSIIVIAG